VAAAAAKRPTGQAGQLSKPEGAVPAGQEMHSSSGNLLMLRILLGSEQTQQAAATTAVASVAISAELSGELPGGQEKRLQLIFRNPSCRTIASPAARAAGGFPRWTWQPLPSRRKAEQLSIARQIAAHWRKPTAEPAGAVGWKSAKKPLPMDKSTKPEFTGWHVPSTQARLLSKQGQTGHRKTAHDLQI